MKEAKAKELTAKIIAYEENHDFVDMSVEERLTAILETYQGFLKNDIRYAVEYLIDAIMALGPEECDEEKKLLLKIVEAATGE